MLEGGFGAEDEGAGGGEGGGDAGEHAAAAAGGDDGVEGGGGGWFAVRESGSVWVGTSVGRLRFVLMGGGTVHAQAGVLGYQLLDLLFDFQGHGALAEDDVWMVVWGDEDGAGALDHVFDYGFALFGRAAAEDHFGAVAFRRCDLGRGGNSGHDDVGGNAARAGGERECLRMVAWGEGNESIGTHVCLGAV